MLTIQRVPVRCPFPACVLRPEHDGDHQFARPAQPTTELTLLQVFDGRYQRIRCEVGPYQHLQAVALYKDQLGFGWMLCKECSRRFIPFMEGAA